MSAYNLRKATSRIQREDSIADLFTVNQWRRKNGLNPVTPNGPSLRRLENAVALGIKDLDITTMPELVRGKSFYISILPEIK